MRVGIISDWMEETTGGRSGCATATCTIAVVFILFILQLVAGARSRFAFRLSSRKKPSKASPKPLHNSTVSSSPRLHHGISSTISDLELKTLIRNLDFQDEEDKWENVVEKSNNQISYYAKCCKPKDGPVKYLSVTIFEDCSVEKLKEFYMDNEYRKQWDKTVVDHQQLQFDEASGTEFGRTIKKFPLLTSREYVLVWRLWNENDGTNYCFSKECEHRLAPRQKKYVRVKLLRSGWRIRKVPGRNACEIKMIHQEDAGLNVEMAKLAFAKGIWSYVCKMNDALRKYKPTTTSNAVTFIHKAPPVSEDTSLRKLARTASSQKRITNGLLVLGGLICLSRGHSSFGAKVAVACILGKLTKSRGAA
jgi:hypothetical protein